MQNKKIQIILKVVLPWLLLLSVIGVGGTLMLFSKLDEEEKVLEEANQTYSDTLDQLASFEDISKTYDSYKGNKENFQKMLVSKSNTLELIQELEEAARITGVTLKTSVGEAPLGKKGASAVVTEDGNTSSNQDVSKVDKVDPVWLQIDLEGNFLSTVRFIKYVENAEKMVSIPVLTISQQKISTPESLLENKEGSLGMLHSILLVSNDF